MIFYEGMKTEPDRQRLGYNCYSFLLRVELYIAIAQYPLFTRFIHATAPMSFPMPFSRSASSNHFFEFLWNSAHCTVKGGARVITPRGNAIQLSFSDYAVSCVSGHGPSRESQNPSKIKPQSLERVNMAGYTLYD